MAQFNRKNKYNFWHSPLILMILFCVIVVFAYNMIGLIQKERETNRNKIAELNKIEDLRKRETNLNLEINKLNTEEGVEESIRDKFQVVKPGEKMVVIVDDNSNSQKVEDEVKDHSFWGFIKRMFGIGK